MNQSTHQLTGLAKCTDPTKCGWAVPYPNDVFSEIDEGYGRVDEVEVHWGWIFGFGVFVGGVATSVVWSLL